MNQTIYLGIMLFRLLVVITSILIVREVTVSLYLKVTDQLKFMVVKHLQVIDWV